MNGIDFHDMSIFDKGRAATDGAGNDRTPDVAAGRFVLLLTHQFCLFFVTQANDQSAAARSRATGVVDVIRIEGFLDA